MAKLTKEKTFTGLKIMIPKTEIVYSRPYIRLINDVSELTALDLYKRTRTIGVKFEKVFNKYINKIIKVIPQITGYKWQQRYVPIYLVDFTERKKNQYSMSRPLTLFIKEDILLMLVVLIHELIHVNFAERKKVLMSEPNFIFRRFLEDMAVNLVVKKVVKRINLRTRLQIKKMDDKTISRIKKVIGQDKRIKPIPINLDKETIKQSRLNQLSFYDLVEK